MAASSNAVAMRQKPQSGTPGGTNRNPAKVWSVLMHFGGVVFEVCTLPKCVHLTLDTAKELKHRKQTQKTVEPNNTSISS